MNFERVDEQGPSHNGDTVEDLCLGGEYCIGCQSPEWIKNCCVYCSRLIVIWDDIVYVTASTKHPE